MRKSGLPVQINFFEARDGHLVVSLEGLCLVIKVLQGLSLAMQSHSYLG